MNNKTVYALLDYDGYICKSYYANKEDIMNMDEAESILYDLTKCSVQKAKDYFKTNNVKCLPMVSGHSWKKDIYPSYKAHRKRNEYLGLYREHIIKKMSKDIVIADCLEADELIVCTSDYLRANKEKFIVFSDDKDLRYYSELYCKINITEQIEEQDLSLLWKMHLMQMLIGDKEDNIQGIPKVGEKTAEKLLDVYGYDIASVVQCYKDKQVDIDTCLKDLLLVIPLSQDYLEDRKLGHEVGQEIIIYGEADALDIYKAIESQVKYLNKKVTEIYKDNE